MYVFAHALRYWNSLSRKTCYYEQDLMIWRQYTSTLQGLAIANNQAGSED